MHTCPGNGCTIDVDSSQLACNVHWFKIPAELRGEIWAAYRQRRSNPDRHRRAVSDAIAFLEAL